MRDLDVRIPRRVVGRQALEKNIRGLIVRVVRFNQHRARSAADALWSARVIDELRAMVGVHSGGSTDGPVT
jgi:hypothetical protein